MQKVQSQTNSAEAIDSIESQGHYKPSSARPIGRSFLLAGLAASAAITFGTAVSLVGANDHAGHGVQNATQNQVVQASEPTESTIFYRTTEIDELEIFYREAGSRDNPTVLLLHGFPTSSHMFRNLIPQLADRYHVIAPDYPGYGNSSMPLISEFDYTFDNMYEIVEDLTEQLELDSYSIYLMDYGAPIGYRLAAANPEKVDSLIIQNGNAYVEGLREFWEPIQAYWEQNTPQTREALRGFLNVDVTEWQYTHGTRDASRISPDTWLIDQYGLDRPGNQEIQLDMFYDYRTNVPLYPEWQAYFREYQPPAIIVWGKNDYIFPEEGAHPYKRDLKNLEFHLFDTGHFALEEDGEAIGGLIRDFLDRNVKR